MGSTGRSDDEVRRLMQQYEDALYRQSAALREQKESQRDAILAKLAARKKMKEESTRETAVTRELQQILHDQVIYAIHKSLFGSFSEILKISQIFGPTLTIYRYFIALIQTFCISVVRTYTILTGIYVYLPFD